MELPHKIESLDEVAKTYHKLYTEGEDGFTLNVTGIEKQDVSGLKSALQKERDNNSDLQKRLKKLEDAAEEADKQRREAEREAAEKSGDVEQIKANLRQQHETEIEGLNGKIAARDRKLEKVLIRDEANRMATRHAVDTESVELLSEWIRHRIGVEEKDDDFEVVVRGEQKGLSLKEFEDGLPKQKTLSRLIKASNGAGGGATGSTGTGSPKPPKADLGGTKDERTAAIKEKFPDLNE